MRILVFSHPRSASTWFQEIVGHVYRIGILGEPFNNKIDKPNEFIQLHDDYVIKICTPVLNKYNYEAFNFTVFDQVYVTDRKDFALACTSVYYAQLTGTYQWSIQQHLNDLKQFVVPRNFINGFISDYRVFLNTLHKFKDSNIEYQMFYYEDILADIEPIIDSMPNTYTADMSSFKETFVPTGINYKDLCQNYNELEEAFAHLHKERNAI
jgi:hypothetical protein